MIATGLSENPGSANWLLFEEVLVHNILKHFSEIKAEIKQATERYKLRTENL